MKTKAFFIAVAIVAAGALSAKASTVTFTPNAAGNYMDIFYTPSAGSEFTNWDLVCQPQIGSILDSNTGQRGFNTSAGSVPVDTFANTVFSAVGAGPASYVFTQYNPGSAFPPVPADQPPTAGASGIGNTPNQLNWSIFDTANGDGAITGFTPYHMARVVFSAGGKGQISVKVFDTAHTGVGESFQTQYGAVVPEPATFALAGLSLLGLVAAGRRRS
jgi:hypothetical protein